MFYTLINYFDVYGNPKDGFTVNDQCTEINDLYLADDTTPKEICTYLKNAGYLRTDDMRKLSVVDDGTVIEIQLKNGHPLFGLYPNENCNLEPNF